MSLTHSVSDDMVERFLSRLLKMKGDEHGTYQLYRRALECYCDWLAGTGQWADNQPRSHTAIDASPLDIEDYVLDLKAQDYAENTIRAHVTALNKCYTTAIEKFELLESHPVHGIDLDELDVETTRENDDRIRYITEEEMDQMLDALPEDKHYIRNKLILELFWQTGLRKGELRHIELERVTQADNRIRVYGSKTGEWRYVHYQPSLNQLLSLWIEVERPLMHDSEYLFPAYDAELISEKELRTVITDAAEDINEVIGETQDGKPKYRISPHVMRHSHAVKALKDGVPIRAVQEQLGHKNIETTMTYLQFTEDDVAESYTRFSA